MLAPLLPPFIAWRSADSKIARGAVVGVVADGGACAAVLALAVTSNERSNQASRMALAWQHGAWVPFPGFLASLPRDGID